MTMLLKLTDEAEELADDILGRAKKQWEEDLRACVNVLSSGKELNTSLSSCQQL